MSSAVGVQHIAKAFGQFQAVREATFEVRFGEIFALLGPNGAGKSTIIRMILDIIRPDSGTIRVFGCALDDAAKNQIGYLPEERGLYKSQKVLDMMTYLGTLKGLKPAESRKRAMSYLERLELADFAKKKVSDLSKGMQQKVQFAVTIMHEPRLLIIDEPFSGLDPVNRMVIKDWLYELRQKGAAIVMSTHQMNQVEEMADRLLMISRGQQRLYGDVRTIREQYALHAIIVEGEGDWARLDGVTQVEALNEQRRGAVRLHLRDDVSYDDILAAIARDDSLTIERFERAVPSLDDIFIQVAAEDAQEVRWLKAQRQVEVEGEGA